jgi:hypothetical protein
VGGGGGRREIWFSLLGRNKYPAENFDVIRIIEGVDSLVIVTSKCSRDPKLSRNAESTMKKRALFSLAAHLSSVDLVAHSVARNQMEGHRCAHIAAGLRQKNEKAALEHA